MEAGRADDAEIRSAEASAVEDCGGGRSGCPLRDHDLHPMLKFTTEIAKSLSIQPDLPTPSPRTAFFRKRKFEQVSDSEFEEEGEDRRPETPVDSSGIMQGGRVYVDEAISSEDSLFDGSVGPIAEMSGALQDLEGEDLHLYSAD